MTARLTTRCGCTKLIAVPTTAAGMPPRDFRIALQTRYSMAPEPFDSAADVTITIRTFELDHITRDGLAEYRETE